jgi:tetratricopeptide (TPR) repeat protein
LSYFALGDYDRAIGAFLHGIKINPAYMACHYELAVTSGLCGYDEATESEAALGKADWPHVSTEFIADRRLAETYFRGKKAAGLAWRQSARFTDLHRAAAL